MLKEIKSMKNIMNKTATVQQTQSTDYFSQAKGLGMHQRRCACGSHTPASGECPSCATKKKIGMQRKLKIGASNDPLEREADRVAEQVMAMPLNSGINATPPRIQRFSGQASDGLTTAPASVDRVLASSGRPLEPALRQDMESRFGYDFSQVRVHTGGDAEQSARDVNAQAYTVGGNVVFGEGRFASDSHEGQRLIAHELVHVVQQDHGVSRAVQRATFEDCTTAQQGTISPAIGIAVGWLNTAISALAVNPLDARTSNALWLAFRDDSRATADTVRGKLSMIRSALPSATIECEQPNGVGYDFICGADTIGYTSPLSLFYSIGNIHLCMGHWDSDNDTYHAHALIHESAHLFCQTSDAGYFDSRDCTDTSDTASLGQASRLDNADSFACFVRMTIASDAMSLTESRADYSGATMFEIRQLPVGAIDLNAADVRRPLFSVHKATMRPAATIPGFQFRWVIRDENDNRYLMIGIDGESVFHFGDHVWARIGRATRALLKERGIRVAEVLCRLSIPQIGDRLLTLPVTFRE
jgi:hypothetical protein